MSDNYDSFKDLEKDVTIILEETETVTTFRIFPQIVQEGNCIGHVTTVYHVMITQWSHDSMIEVK